MAFPPVPTVPSGVRENTTPQVNLHPEDHTLIHQALTDIINELGSNPSGDAPSLTAWLSILNPVGEIKMFGGASAPSGWAICNGDVVSRTTYSDLFAVIGTNFGAGDGSTTFALPNLRGRSPLGFWAGSYAGTLGAYVGNQNTVLPAHNHNGVTPPGEGGVDHLHVAGELKGPVHGHNLGNDALIKYYEPSGTEGDVVASNGQRAANAVWKHDGGGPVTGISGAADRGLSHQHTIPNAGTGDGTNTNIHPVTIVNFIIRLT